MSPQDYSLPLGKLGSGDSVPHLGLIGCISILECYDRAWSLAVAQSAIRKRKSCPPGSHSASARALLLQLAAPHHSIGQTASRRSRRRDALCCYFITACTARADSDGITVHLNPPSPGGMAAEALVHNLRRQRVVDRREWIDGLELTSVWPMWWMHGQRWPRRSVLASAALRPQLP
jgi:hypothetical protein